MASVASFLRQRAAGRIGGIRLLPTRANAQPAFAYCVEDEDGFFCSGLFVIGIRDGKVASLTRFAGGPHMAAFDVPPRLD